MTSAYTYTSNREPLETRHTSRRSVILAKHTEELVVETSCILDLPYGKLTISRAVSTGWDSRYRLGERSVRLSLNKRDLVFLDLPNEYGTVPHPERIDVLDNYRFPIIHPKNALDRFGNEDLFVHIGCVANHRRYML